MATDTAPPNHLDPAVGSDDFRTLFDLLPIGAYRSSTGGRQLRANAALVRMNGYGSEAELLAGVANIGAEWYVEPDRRRQFRELLERDDRVLGFVSEVYRHKTRERIWVSENAHAVRDHEGRIVCYEGTVEEITGRVRTEAALQRSETHLRQIADHLPCMLYRGHYRDGAIVRYSFVSRGIRDLYGVEPEALLADPLVLRQYRHPEDAAAIDAAVGTAIASGSPLSLELRIVLGDGTVKWVQMSSSAASPEGDEQVRVGIMLDVSAQRHAEALRGERDRAADAQRAMSTFMSKVSHELRTPLNAILGFGQLLETERGLPPRPSAWVHELMSSGRHLLELVDDILDLSGVQSGLMRFERKPVLLRPVIEECHAMLAVQAAARQLGWVADIDPMLAADADRQRLKQVLANLLSNAIKYNRVGGEVRVAARQCEGRIEIAVTDTGPGLGPAERARLFLPFDRLGAERSGITGSGLGLALSRQLTIGMDGEIRVDSQPGKGSTFTIRLPAADSVPIRRGG